jgi:two-component system chemotaxis sensor kinase CheA
VKDVLDQAAATFREEASERLAELESTLLELEANPCDMELVARAFRAMHTIKGSGAMFGYDEVASFTHELETVFDEVRKGRIAIDAALIGQALAGKDLIRLMLEQPAADTQDERRRLVEQLRARLPQQGAAPPVARGRSGARGAARRTYHILFAPYRELFADGTNPLGLLDELTTLGECSTIAHTTLVPPLESIDPESCFLQWNILLTTSATPETIRDVFLFVEDRCALRIDLVDDGESLEDGDYKRLGEILVERGHLTTEQLEQALRDQRRIGELLLDKGVVPAEAVEAAALEQKVVREARARREAGAKADSGSSIRVSADRLDGLVDLVGELVIAQARLNQLSASRQDTELAGVVEEMERLATDLRRSTLDMRMVPIGTTFGRFKRQVRDLSAELCKEIDLVTEGAETELDKTVIERLGDPLVHLIRNSCDHGVESPEARCASGKARRGTVKLSAYHTGPNVYIEIEDDGAGIDVEAVRAKAVERGLLAPDARPPLQEVLRLIFLPGFSTAGTVSEVSGRGVGMDVVKRSIDALRGSVEVESRRGQGTIVRLRLPLTLAIIEGLLVAVGEARFVLPMSLVEECVQLVRPEAERTRDSDVAVVRGNPVPCLRLRQWFDTDDILPLHEQVVITTVDDQRFGFVVDRVIGPQQTVIKTLGRLCEQSLGISGATILGDGNVALIVDVPALVREAGLRAVERTDKAS